MKIDKRKKYMVVLDIETANSAEDAIAYDIGFAVVDKKGNIYESYSFMMAEMFLNHSKDEMMTTAYYAEKLPNYWKDYRKGERKLVSIYTARKILKEVCEKWNIGEIWAYNAYFDKSGCNRTLRYLTKSRARWFFPYGVEIKCIWHYACQTLCKQRNFFKFCTKNGFISPSGNLKTSAEVVYAYMTDNPDFEESHTGLEDVEIEAAILSKCIRQHKKADTNINRLCWRIPQSTFRVWQNA